MKHPNATTAGGTTAIGVAVVWLAGYFGLDLSAEAGAAIAGAATTLVLFVGRKGIRGSWGTVVLRGYVAPHAVHAPDASGEGESEP